MRNQTPLAPGKKSNIELLRILAMLGIVMFHHFGQTSLCSFISLPEGFKTDSYFYDVVTNTTNGFDPRTLLLDFCYGHFGDGGNLIFMLITGYFAFGKPLNYEKNLKSVARLLLLTVFFGCIITALHGIAIKFFYPFAGIESYRPRFNLPNWLSGANMWYFQAYGVFLLVILPILKHFEPKVDQRVHKILIGTLVSLFFLDYTKYLSGFWLSMRLLEFTACYYIGGYIAKYPVNISWKKLFSALAVYVAVYFLYEYYWRVGMRKMYDPSEYSYISVMSPLICCLIFAVLVFLMFSKVNFTSRTVNHISKAVPGIYVFHHSIISLWYVFANMLWWQDWSLQGYCIFVAVDTLILFAVGYLLDLPRRFLFSRLKL